MMQSLSTGAQLAHDQIRAATTDFAGVYLNTAGEGLYLNSHDQLLREYSKAKALGYEGRQMLLERETSARGRFGQLLGVSPGTLAFVPSSSRALNLILDAIDFQPGDEVVTTELEFPPTQWTLKRAAQNRYDLKIVQAPDNYLEIDDLYAAITPKTRLVVLSLVSFKNGQMLPTGAISQHVHATRGDAMVFVDGVQGIGATNYRITHEDFVSTSGYKWLMAFQGSGALYASPRVKDVLPTYVGYKGVKQLFPFQLEGARHHEDARRFEEGMPNYLGIMSMDNALGALLEAGIDNIAEYNRFITRHLVTRLQELGLPLLGGEKIGSDRGAIVAFERSDYAEFNTALKSRGVYLWGLDHRIRVSPHIYNTLADVDCAVDAIAALVR